MEKLFKTSALIGVLTLSSRVLGVIRDMVIAMIFGTTIVTDAFFIAFRPFDMVRKLFAEGVLSISFIPVFSGTLEEKGKKAAIHMLFSFVSLISVFAVVAMLVGLIFAPQIIGWIAPGFEPESRQYHLTVMLFKIMLPYFWLTLLTALSMGVLNTFGNFGAPAVAPVVFNLVMITFTLTAVNFFQIPVLALAVGVCAGGVIQLLLQIPFLIRCGIFKWYRFALFSPGSLYVLKTMLPCMIGAASYQINVMAASFFASTLDEGSVSALYYSDRLVQFPLALFAVSVATVFLPELSRKAAGGKISDMGELFSRGVILVLFVTIPAMAGLMALDTHIVRMLFGHGAFDENAVHLTADTLFILVTGLWAFTGTRLFVTAYYAVSNIRVPFISGVAAIFLNLILCPFLGDIWGLKGMVLSVSISAAVGFSGLFFLFPGSIGMDRLKITVSACRSLFFSAIMFVLVRKAAEAIPLEGTDTILYSLGIAGCISLGIAFYFGVNHLVSSPELKMLKRGVAAKQ